MGKLLFSSTFLKRTQGVKRKGVFHFTPMWKDEFNKFNEIIQFNKFNEISEQEVIELIKLNKLIKLIKLNKLIKFTFQTRCGGCHP